MKRQVILFAVIISTYNLFGQGFVYPGNQWNVRYDNMLGGYDTYIFKLYGDTLVGDKIYSKMQTTIDTLKPNWLPSGLVREESDRVYFLDNYGLAEGLLYDFNLQAGDITRVVSIWSPEPRPFVCVKVDSIVNSGITHKRWTFDDTGWPSDQWIAGIGSVRGPLYSGSIPTDTYLSLLCFHRNDTLRYMDPYAGNCIESNIGIEEHESGSEITCSPNPVERGQMLRISSYNSINEIELVNAMGRVIRRISGIQDKLVAISTADLTSGIYIVSVSNVNNILLKRKISIR
jgi:hypothetical protein